MRETAAHFGFLILVTFALCGLGPRSHADAGAGDINEGELRFLSEPPESTAHEQRAQITIDRDSLTSGWVRMKQCHHRLAAAGAMEVVFDRTRVRALRVAQAEGIGRAWVEGASVQLVDVRPDAVLCILSENRALHREGNGNYEWRGGPYMRRFLDGYFPIQLTLAIDYPPQHLRFERLEPGALGLKTIAVPGHVRVETLFAGRLTVSVRFEARDRPADRR